MDGVYLLCNSQGKYVSLALSLDSLMEYVWIVKRLFEVDFNDITSSSR